MKKTKKKPRKKATPTKIKPNTFQKSDHPIARHAGEVREIVHTVLAEHGIHDLSLTAMHFSAEASSEDPCRPNQHREMICQTGPDGGQICQWECVAN